MFRQICKASRQHLAHLSILLIEWPAERREIHLPQITPSQSDQHRYGTTYSSSSIAPSFIGSSSDTTYRNRNIDYAPLVRPNVHGPSYTYPAVAYAHPIPSQDSHYPYNTWSADPSSLPGQMQFYSYQGQTNGYTIYPESTDGHSTSHHVTDDLMY